MKRICFLVLVLVEFGMYQAQGQQPTTNTATTKANVTWVQGVGPGYRPTAGSGLILDLGGGTAFCGGVTQNYASGTLTLAASATSYVYLDPASNCAPIANTSGFTSSVIPIAIVATSSNTITAITDVRTEFVAPVSLGAGSCPANQFVTAVGGAGPTCAQPGFANLSGSAAIAQLPLATSASQGILQLGGDLSGTAAAPVVAGLQRNPVSAAAPAANQFLGWNGSQWTPAQPSFSNLSGSATSGQLPAATAAAQGAIQLTGDWGGTSASPQVVSTHLASPLPVPQGGSGTGNLTTHGVLLGEGTSAFSAVTPGASGQCLLSSGASADPSFAACPVSSPGGSSTQFEYDNSGAFGGTANFSYAASTGVVSLNQMANGNDTLYGVRSTDTSPSGNLIHFQNYARTADLFKVDASGNVTATSFTSPSSGAFVMSGSEAACSGAAPGLDVLCLGDSASHTAQLALNGGSFVSIPQLAGDLGGTGSAPRVTALQGNPVSSAAPSANQVLAWNGSTWTPTPANSGTVTSVSLSVPAEFTVSGSPLTTSGTLTIGKANQPPNQVYAGPASGSSAAPGFRSLVPADLPAATASAPGIVQLAGDLGGTSGTPRVTWLQGYPLSSTAPAANQVLTYSGTAWAPAPLPAAAGLGSCAANQFVTATTSGAPTCAQPALSGLSGTATSNQLPAATASAQGAVQLAGDVGGTSASPQVVSTHLASPLAVVQGGSGMGNLTAHGVLLGEGTNAFSAVTPAASGQCLLSSGASADPSFAACPVGLPGGASTQFEYDNSGAFGGTPNFSYASSTGVVSLNQMANGNDAFYGVRSTDTSPTGNLIHFQNYARTSDLFKVDASGNITATSFTSPASGAFVVSGSEGACSGAAAGLDVLCLGDSATHTAQLALNGGSFIPIPQLAGDLGGTGSAPQVVATHLGHLNQTAANGDVAGTIAVSGATSASHTFTLAFNSAPVCVLTPVSQPASGVSWWVTASATSVTAYVSSSSTITFNYLCSGNPN